MIYGQIKGFDKDISRVILGCSNLRTDRCEFEKCLSIYETAYANGINTYDNAVIYGDSEYVIGKWIEEKIKADPNFRDKITVISKGAHYNSYRRRLTPFDILSDLHESLAKSKLNYIDIYLLHRDDPDFPVGPIIEVLNRLRDEGKIRIFGVSNWTHIRIEEANNYALKHHLEPIRVSSPNFTLGKLNENFFQHDDAVLCGDNEALKWYTDTKMPVFAWASLARGFYAGRFKSGNQTAPDDKFLQYLYKVMANDRNFEILAGLERQATNENSTVMQVTLKELIKQPFPVYPIFSTSNVEHIKEAGATKW